MTNNAKIGDKGELLAIKHLTKIGHKILATKWHFSHKEVDIITEFDNQIIIVEVKTRKKNSIIKPSDAVNKAKQINLIKAAQAYIEQNNLNSEVRFDIVSVIYSGKNFEIEHIEDAFYPYL